ncbi:MAG: M36 family metallopeptidase [Elusimicrobiota bacterium]
MTALRATLPQTKEMRYRFDAEGSELRMMTAFKTQDAQGRQALDVAREFLSSNSTLLGFDQRTVLRAGVAHEDGQRRDLLFNFTHEGIPVEFSKASVHMTPANEVHTVFSGWDRDIVAIAAVPTVTEEQARQVASTQWVKPIDLSKVKGELVYLPKRFEREIKDLALWKEAKAHLAWKFTFRLSKPFGRWSVYVDAHSAALIGAVNALKSNVTMKSAYWPKDPTGPAVTSTEITGAIAFESSVGGPISTLVDDDGDGIVITDATKNIYAVPRTTAVTVIDYRGVGQVVMETADGAWEWKNIQISSASISPYSLNVSEEKTFSCPTATVLSSLRFNKFDVGYLAPNSGAEQNSTDDFDHVDVLQPTGNKRIAVYMGQNRNAFSVFPATGTEVTLRLVSNETDGAGTEQGYRVNLSSCLVQKTAVGGDPVSLTFTDADSSSGDFAINNAMFHSNFMYFQVWARHGLMNRALKDRPADFVMNFSTNLVNAFFDPESDAVYFGTGGTDNQNRNLGLASDIIYHEYTHWVVERVCPLSNFGQSGAISEGVADFFALDSYNGLAGNPPKTTFGEWVFPGGTCGTTGASCRDVNNTKKYPNDWQGEIHYDGQIIAGALWDLRTVVGYKAARTLVSSSLFYFPDSFDSFLDAMWAVSGGTYDGAITTAFANHGIGAWPYASADPLEPNNGFANAKTLTLGESPQATVFPAGDVDYFRFVAGAGPVKITLTRPFLNEALLYVAYGLQVFDIGRQEVGSDMPDSVFEVETSPGVKYSLIENQTATISFNLAVPQVLYVSVSAPFSVDGNNDRTSSSQLAYTINAQFQAPVDTLAASQVTATLADQRNIRITALNLTGFSVAQSTETTLHHVDVLDHAGRKLSSAKNLTEANGGLTGIYDVPGRIEATVVLPATFFTDNPSVGSVKFEPFVSNPILLQNATSYSLGISNEVKIFSASTGLILYNNVFNPAKGEKATFKYESSQAGDYRLVAYTLGGDLVKVLAEGREDIGMRSVDWDGRNGSGDTVASGVYLIHLEGPGVNVTKKAVVVK